MSQQLAEIQRALGRIEGVVGEIKAGMARGAERTDKHDARLGKLENRQHWYAGIAAGIGTLLGIGGSHMLKP